MGTENGGEGVRRIRAYSVEKTEDIRRKHVQTMIGHVREQAVHLRERFKNQIEGSASNMAQAYTIRELEDMLLERVPKGWPEKSKTEGWLYLIALAEALSLKYDEREREQTGRE